MGYDKYGLNWSVWGSTSNVNKSSSSNPLLDSVGKGWSKTPNQTSSEEQESETKPDEITAYLRNARFVPDETTDFNQPCKVTVEIESKKPVKSSVVFSLWGKYKDKEQNLQHEVKVEPNGSIADGVLKLYYIDAYYDDVAAKTTDGQKAQYIVKCSMKGASPVESEPMDMPRSKDIMLDFEDDQGLPIKDVKVTLSNEKVFSSDDKGHIVIPTEENGEEVEIIKIELPEKTAETEGTPSGVTSESS